MDNAILFIVEIAVVVVLVCAVIFGAIYISRSRERDSPRGSANSGGQAGGEAERQQTPLKFYKTMSHEAEGEIQVHLYSPEEYRDMLGGDPGAGKNGEFVAVLKAYKYLENDWYEMRPERSAELLEMQGDDYETDEARTALLVRKLPPGTPYAARERFVQGT